LEDITTGTEAARCDDVATDPLLAAVGHSSLAKVLYNWMKFEAMRHILIELEQVIVLLQEQTSAPAL
jgi:hypothetical protein